LKNIAVLGILESHGARRPFSGIFAKCVAMTTAIDTNIFVVLWDKEDDLNLPVQSALDTALGRGRLIVSAPVYAELLGYPSRSEDFLDHFFKESGIVVDWRLDEMIWRTAGRAFQAYAARRRPHPDPGPRRILANFLIGAHAVRHGIPLLSLDNRIYQAAFPRLTIMNVQDL
jgi:predicted nucleic acid-binding protein